MFDNRSLLASQGLLYPDISLRGYGHHDIAFLLDGGYPDWATPPAEPLDLTVIEGQLRAVAGDERRILLSSEDFYLYPQPERLHGLLERAGIAGNRPIVVVVYLRRQDDAHESWYNQAIKAQGSTEAIGPFMARWRDLWDYRLQLDRWAAAFGRANLRVRLYDEQRFTGGTLFDDFFETIGHGTHGFTFPATAINTSLNRDLVDYQRLVNTLPLSAIERRRFHHQLMDLSTRTKGSGLFDERPFLDPADRQRILAEYQASNDAVATRYLGGAPIVAPSTTGAQQPAAGAPAGLSIEKLAVIQAWLMAKSGVA